MMPSNSDWDDLCQMINETMPTFKTQILKQYPVSEKEYKICMLSKLGFKPYQMANLMGLSCSDISQTRRRLFVKIFHIKGSASDFDHYCPRKSFNISKSNKLIVTHQN